MRRSALPVVVLLALLAGCNRGSDVPTIESGGTTASTTASSPTSAPDTTATTAAASSTTAATPKSTPTTAAAAPPAPPAGVGVLPAGSPGTVASALESSESAIRNPGTPLEALEPHGRAQQVAYRQLSANLDWMDAVLQGVPAGLHATVRANASAGAELRALTKPQPSLPPWRIVAPAPATELLGYYKAAEAEIGAPWPYLAAIHLVETRMGRIRGTSTAGAQGPMQFLPATWGQYGAGGDINSNRDAIFAAARLLVRNGAPGNMANALFNYNRSQRYVNAVTAYAEQMKGNERAYYGYYHWQVYYRLADGDRLLEVGYGG